MSNGSITPILDQLPDVEPTITKHKVHGDADLIEDILDMLYDYNTKSMWFNQPFYDRCKVLIELSIEHFNYYEFMNCDQYDIKLNTDGSFYLTIVNYNEVSINNVA